jgi:hypothetical protein
MYVIGFVLIAVLDSRDLKSFYEIKSDSESWLDISYFRIASGGAENVLPRNQQRQIGCVKKT